MKTRISILALVAISSITVGYAARSPFEPDFFRPDQGFYVRADAAVIAFSGANSYTCYGGMAAIGARFAESENWYHGVELRAGALFGSFSEAGQFKVGNTSYKYSASADNTAAPVIAEYSLAYRVDDDLSVFGSVGGGVMFTQQTIKDTKVTGLNVKGTPEFSGTAPIVAVGAGVRYNFSHHVQGEVGYRYTRVFSYDREGSAQVGNTSYDITARAESANAHLFYAGLTWKF